MLKPASTAVGVLHPGAMGASVAACARANVQRVLWVSEGRSGATCRRAAAAQLADCGNLESLVTESDVLISVCPPADAISVARAVAELNFAGWFVDANAVSPETARAIETCFASTDATVVDAGIIGPPANREGTTRLHLSGRGADDVARCFAKGPLEARVVDGPVGAASALKMAFAGYSKGSLALVAACHALAAAEGVGAELSAEWEKMVPDAIARLRAGVPATAPKAWRFVGEMNEIAASFEAVGLPGDFHRAAAEIYARLSDFKDAETPPTVDAVIHRLRTIPETRK